MLNYFKNIFFAILNKRIGMIIYLCLKTKKDNDKKFWMMNGDNFILYNDDNHNHPKLLLKIKDITFTRINIDMVINPYKFEEYKKFIENGHE
jgi:hypothetical protein